MAKAKVSARTGAARSGRKAPKRKPRGALAAICALLVTSGLLRLAVGASEAIAREGDTAPKPQLEAALAADAKKKK